MSLSVQRNAHRSPIEAPEDPDSAPMPVEPDEGPIPAMIPDDPEHDRLVDPEDWPTARPSLFG
jgi:hypothetical protein